MSLHVTAADLVAAGEHNPYLHRLYSPAYEELTLTGLEVEGELPADLHGVYVRNGPNPQHEPRARYHWLDGDAMVCAGHFEEGTATYRNRWVRTDGFERERAAGETLWRGIMEPP